jgi:hypothetical protein
VLCGGDITLGINQRAVEIEDDVFDRLDELAPNYPVWSEVKSEQ